MACPSLSTSSAEAVGCYRRGIAELVAGTGNAESLLAEALAIDPMFLLAGIGAAVAQVVAGQPYSRARRGHRPLRGEGQHAEIVDVAFMGDATRAAYLRREHLLEFPGDLLIVWLPALGICIS